VNNYNFLDKIFHNLIFSSKFTQKSLYEVQKILFKKNEDYYNNMHVFITGLPRSGSTAFLYYLYESNLFASLTYRDMPFVISPRLNFFNKKNIEKKERLHKDGIEFDLDTPEALDNVFFKLFNDQEIILEIENYVNSILEKYKKKRYLSKNNNILKKLDLINNKFQNSFFIIPFRRPQNQANSLFKQHLNFTELHKKDKFVLKYMSDLGHFEFGKEHQFWFEPKYFNDTSNINYWLEQWFMYYSYIYEKFSSRKNFILASHEKFCGDLMYRNKLNMKLDIKTNINFKLNENNQNKNIESFDNILLERCNQLYIKLDKQLIMNN
jgi:hypothetical protein